MKIVPCICLLVVMLLVACVNNQPKGLKNNECFELAAIPNLEGFHYDTASIQVFAIGESTHGSSTLLATRIELTKMLIEKDHFMTVGIEATFNEVLELNKFASGASDESAETVVKRLGYPFLANVEFTNFLKWLKAINSKRKSQERIAIFGIDTSVSNAPIKGIMDFAKKYSKSLSLAFDTLFREVQDSGIYRMGSSLYSSSIKPIDPFLKDKLQIAQKLIRIDRQKLISLSSKEEFELFNFNLNMIEQLNDRLQYSINSLKSQNSRDSSMFLNVKNHASKTNKVIVWAHNEHIKANNESNPQKTMGTFLKEHFSNRFVNIGIDFGTGTYHKSTPYGLQVDQALNTEKQYEKSNEVGYYNFLRIKDQNCILKISVHSLGAFSENWSIQEQVINDAYTGYIYLPISKELNLLNN
jgi:erythromycin esterase-like protein